MAIILRSCQVGNESLIILPSRLNEKDISGESVEIPIDAYEMLRFNLSEKDHGP